MVGSKISSTVVAALVGSVVGCTGNSGGSDPMDESDQVFDTSVLHEIRIEVAPEHLPSLEYDHEKRVPCTFTFDGIRLENATIRQKGSGTHAGSLYTKPSFSVRFDDIVRGQKLHGLDKLILNNAGMDPTLVHEHLGFDLYRRAGMPSRRTAHAVVTLAGMPAGEQIYGVYVMVEAVDERLIERHFGEAYDNGNLFEDENDAGDFAADPQALDLKDEDKPGRSRQRLVEFANFLNTATDEELLARLDEFIDLEQALESFAVDLLSQHGDGFWLASHNYYLYEHPRDHRFVFLPHGMDMLFEPTGKACGTVPDPLHLPTVLGERISTHPELRARVEQALDRVLAEVWDVPLMEARMDALGALLDASSHDEPVFVAERAAHHASREALSKLLQNTAQAWRPATPSQCGDGVLDGNELCASMCEDGNLVDGDGCSAECLVEYCGNWKVDPGLGEVCDGTDGCNWDCQSIIVCGDGILDDSEQCDDGNMIDDDACNNDCTPNCAYEMRANEAYAFCPVPVSHERTRDICGSLQATVAVPRSAEEQAWLVERTGALAAGAWWIGLDSHAGQWLASDGLPVTWLGWGADQPDETPDESPDAGAQTCALLDPALDGAWNDRPCEEEHPVVCKMF